MKNPDSNCSTPISTLQSPIINLQTSPFTFSQNSLQAYVDCPRRFQLRYLFRLAWPAPEVQPITAYEQHLQRGQAFHKLIQQYLAGIPSVRLAKMAGSDPLLVQWWRDFLGENPIPEDYARHVEINLSSPIENHRLAARYDLLAIGEGNFIIFDWKTNQVLPKKESIQSKLQSRVYPYLLTIAGGIINQGKPVDPKQVKMVFWFSNYPVNPIHLHYDQEQYETDSLYFRNMLDTITSMGEEDFPCTEDLNHCRYCVYRSFCGRGEEAGSLDNLDMIYPLEESLVEELDLEIDLDQIAEIEF